MTNIVNIFYKKLYCNLSYNTNVNTMTSIPIIHTINELIISLGNYLTIFYLCCKILKDSDKV
jgi:hypothetical protein